MKRSVIMRAFAAMVLFAILFLFLAVSFSHGFEHNCVGEDCLICTLISTSERLATAATALSLAATVGIFLICTASARFDTLDACPYTPVVLKVKLSN